MTAGRRALFAVLTILLVLGSVEIGLRALAALRAGPRALLYGFLRDPHERQTVGLHDELRAGYSKYRPGAVLRDYDPLTNATFSVHINARGYRGAEFATAKTPGTVRIVTLGASSTFGYHARDDETWPVRLQEQLSRGCSAQRYEVLNLAVPHLTSHEIATLFAAEALSLDPDVVVFYEGVNDASMRQERRKLRNTLRRSDVLRATYRALRDHLLLVRFADEVVRPVGRRFGADDLRARVPMRVEGFLGSLETIRAECERRGIRFVVATQQAASLEIPREQLRGITYAAEEQRVRAELERGERLPQPAFAFLVHAELMRALRRWAAERAVPLVDVVAALDDRRDVLVSWVHLTPEGNEKIAGAFAPTILSLTCAPRP